MISIPTDRALQHRAYETMVTAVYQKELSAGDSFIDLGANIGHHTWQMGLAVGASGRGFAFEPVPEFADRVRNVLKHKQVDWVDVINVAVADYEGECSFYVQADHIGWSSMFEDHMFPGDSEESRTKITVPVRLVDDEVDLSSSGPLRVIKVDVENAEYAALRGCRQILEAHRPMVIFENDPKAASRRSDYSIEEFLDLFTSLDFELWSFHGDKIETPTQWEDSDSSYFLASPRPLSNGLDREFDMESVLAEFQS